MPKAISGVIGRYEIQRALGGGGMGVLYLARDPAIDRPVAIKLLREGLDSPDVRERFSREARSAGRLHHPNIVTIFDVGEHDGQPFIAMEYIHGETLADLIHHQKAVSLVQKLQWMEALCAGLQYAHRAGIIHRDIKPANVMISEEGALKLLDFGIARLGTSAMTHGVIGTPNYMAPEQIEGQTVDARADIFSLGALFYELLSYRRAFPGDVAVVLTQILFKAPEPLGHVVAGLDAQLVAIVDRCLEKRPTTRYADCAVLARDLATVRLRLQHQGAGSPEPADRSTDEEPTAKVDTKRARQRLELRRIRAEQIRSHLEQARAAMDTGAYEEACRSCDQALVLDPEHSQAVELADRARSALESQLIERWVTAGHDELGRGALTAASLLVERALSLDSSSPAANALRQAVDEARRQFEEARDRTHRIEETLATAEHELAASFSTEGGVRFQPDHSGVETGPSDGALERAAALVADALAIDPTHEASLALQARVADALETQRRVEEDASAGTAIDNARRVFAAGHTAEAIEQLAGFQPRHERVSRTLAELQFEAKEIKRRAGAPRAAAVRQQDETRKPLPAATEQVRRPNQLRLGIAVVAGIVVVVLGAVLLWRVPPPQVAPPESSQETRPTVSSPAPLSPTSAPANSTPAPELVDVPPTPSTLPAAAPSPQVQSPPPGGDNDGQARLRSERAKLMVEARTALDQKHYGSAIRTYQRLTTQFPNDSTIRDLLATVRDTDARQLRRSKDLSGQADQALQAGAYDDAIRLYQAAIDEYPDAGDVTRKLNQARAARGRANAAAAEILGPRSGRGTPGLPDEQRAKLFAQANALVAARLIDDAIKIYDRILAAEPDNNEAKQGKARAQSLNTAK